MMLVALTGSMGMGKSATAAMFAARGVPVFDADAAVHEAYGPGGLAVAPVEDAFPGVANGRGGIDRDRLRAKVAGDPDALNRLNAIVHPIVGQMRAAFLAEAEASGAELVLFDVPLLFETGGDKHVDAIIVVTAPAEVQRERVMARGRMTEAEFEAILARQTPDAEKRARADFIIETHAGFPHAERQVDEVLKALRERAKQASQAGQPGVGAGDADA